ncbi:MAG: DNA polymerase III subunit delta [Clostridiales bacterium]|nr:DNA polymerase III subunit delta [Clostridiales bacterium]
MAEFKGEASVQKLIKSKERYNLYFIYGPESYLNENWANRLASSITDTSGSGFNYFKFNDDNITFDGFHEACEGLPMMSDRLCVMVRDFPFFDLKKDELQPYLDYLPNIPDTASVIFFVTKTDPEDRYSEEYKYKGKWKSVVNLFGENSCVIYLPKRSDESLAKMISANAEKAGTTISDKTAKYFIQYVDSDINNLLNEFDKVCAYAGGEEITEEMIDFVCIKGVSDDTFKIIDFIFDKKYDDAFAILRKYNEKKGNPQLLLGTMAFRYVDIYRIGLAAKNGKSLKEIASTFGKYKGYTSRLERTRKYENKLSSACMRESIDAFIEADINIKSYSMDNDLILEQLLAKLINIMETNR